MLGASAVEQVLLASLLVTTSIRSRFDWLTGLCGHRRPAVEKRLPHDKPLRGARLLVRGVHCFDQAGGRSTRGAVLGLRPARLLGPPPAPDVR